MSHTSCLQVCGHKGCLLHSTERAPAVQLVEACFCRLLLQLSLQVSSLG